METTCKLVIARRVAMAATKAVKRLSEPLDYKWSKAVALAPKPGAPGSFFLEVSSPIPCAAAMATAFCTAVLSSAGVGQTPAQQHALDSCRYLTAAEVELYTGPLRTPPYRVTFDNAVPSKDGEACLYRGRDGREVLFQHSSGGAREVGTLMRRIPVVADRVLHNAGASGDVPQQSNPAGGASAVMGSAGQGPWDNSNWYPQGVLVGYKADDAFYINVSGTNGGKPAAADLATRAIARMAQPLTYDGAAAVGQAPKPIKPMPPCSLVPRARAEAILGPLASDPAPGPDGKSCTYVVGSPDGRVSYQMGITWTGGYRSLNMMKHGTSMVSGIMGSTEGAQSIQGMDQLKAQGGGMPNIPKLNGNQAKILDAFTKGVGMPGMGAAVTRGMNSDTTLAGPWDAGTLVHGSWLIVTKDDVGLTIILGTADYDKAKALLAAACEKL